MEKLEKITSNYIGIFLKHGIPFAAGFYVGIADGNNIGIEPNARYALLIAQDLIQTINMVKR